MNTHKEGRSIDLPKEANGRVIGGRETAAPGMIIGGQETAAPGRDDVFFDRHKAITIHRKGMLPHWNQEGKMQYVTFRLADSLPHSKQMEVDSLRQEFESLHPKPWDGQTSAEYQSLMGPVVSRLLDRGYGSCLLAEQENRALLSSTLWHGRGKDYELLDYVIMPNHVHMLVIVYVGRTIGQIVGSIKKFSSRAINARCCREGALWMREYYDRIVRDEDELKHYVGYIRRNPEHLPVGSYELMSHTQGGEVH